VTRISIRLTPRAGRDAIEGWDGTVLQVRVAAPPTEGRANDALVRLVAKALKVAPSRVSVVGGAQSRTKVLLIDGMSADEVREGLAG
jgi:uncharacterized protein (TIGR00251 family)